MTPDFNTLIANAARTYVRAAKDSLAYRSEGAKLAAARALFELDWICTAETYGWAAESSTPPRLPSS